MFKSLMLAAAIALPAGAVPAGHSRHLPVKPASPAKTSGCAKCAKCPMCAQMKAAKAAGQTAHAEPGKAPGMMGGKPASAAGITLSFAPDGTVYAVRGDTVYKLDANLTVVAQIRLGAALAPPADAHAGHQH